MHLFAIRKRLLKQRRFRQVLVLSVVAALILGLLIVPVESRSPIATIRTTSDGLWWAVQTLTTVGYGDVVPVTDLGRVLGTLMQIVGAVLFGVVIAMISTTMSRSQEEFYWTRLFERLDRIETKLAEVEKDSNFLLKKDIKVSQSSSPDLPDQK